jgi:hypothetical protein
MGVPSRFHVFRAQTCFRRYRGRRVPFSCFALSDSLSAVPWASVLFCVPGLIFDGTGGIGSRFLVLRARTLFRHFRGHRFPFSRFGRPYSFVAVQRASCPVFLYCSPGLVFDGSGGVGSRFHVLGARTHLLRYRGRRVPFSYIARPDSFSTVPGVSGPVFMFCAPRLVFDGTEGVGTRFRVLRARSHFRRYRGCRLPFSCFVLPGSFTAYRGRRVPFSCFARPYSFSAVPRGSCPVFMICALGLVFGGAECVGYRFHVLCSRTRFRR